VTAYSTGHDVGVSVAIVKTWNAFQLNIFASGEGQQKMIEPYYDDSRPGTPRRDALENKIVKEDHE